MKILSVNKFYHVFGGSERYFFELNALHERAGHTIIPFAMAHPDNENTPYDTYFVSQVNYWDNPNFVEKARAVGRILYSLEARRRLRQLLEAEQPDIAHLHLIYHQISPSILPVLKEYGLPVVQTLHDYKPICPTHSLIAHDRICERCRGRRFYQATLQQCNHGSFLASLVNTVEMYLHHGLKLYELVDHYITPSEFMRQKMIEMGMPAEKLSHVANFVDPDKYPYSPTYQDYFVFIGRLVPIKGIKTLLLAMQQIKPSIARLLIIGDGPQRAELEVMRKELDLDQVMFVGYQNSGKLKEMLAQSMFSVLPAESYENCPMSILESMSMGKPVVGARIGGIPELIDDGEDGLLFEMGRADDLAQKLNQMLADDQRRLRMGHRAREKIVSVYNAELHHERILTLYQDLIQ